MSLLNLLLPPHGTDTADYLAKQHGVGRETIKRAGNFVSEIGPEKAEAIMKGETTKREVIKELIGKGNLRADYQQIKS